MSLSQNVSHLYTMPHDNAVMSYDIDGEKRYFLNNFYVCGNDGKVPIKIAKDYRDTTISRNTVPPPISNLATSNALVVGDIAGTHANNRVMLVSKQCFAFNPSSLYRIRFKGIAEDSAISKAGIITFTTYPIPDLLNMSDDVNLNQALNMSRFATGTDGFGVFPEADSNQTTDNIYNIEFTSLSETEYTGKVGYFAKWAWPGYPVDPAYDVSSYDGSDISSFTPINGECVYFSVMIHLNTNSTTTDFKRTIFDTLTVDEYHDMYVL